MRGLRRLKLGFDRGARVLPPEPGHGRVARAGKLAAPRSTHRWSPFGRRFGQLGGEAIAELFLPLDRRLLLLALLLLVRGQGAGKLAALDLLL